MSQVLGRHRSRGISASGLRNWGIAFLTVGVFGRGVLQNGMLHLSSVSSMELFEAMQADSNVMIIATIALICQAIETCAAPIFAFLLVEGFTHTSNFEGYLRRVALVGVAAELPYNFAMSGSLLDLESRNPALGIAISLAMLWFFSRFPEKGLKNFLMKAMAFIGAFLWCGILKVDAGNCIVVLTAIIWAVRHKENTRAVFGFTASIICSAFDMFYIVSTMSFMLMHMYNGEEGSQNRIFNYAVYPVLLLAAGIGALLV